MSRFSPRAAVLAGLTACLAVIFFASDAFAKHKEGTGLKNATVLVIRHAEKPETGPGLTPAGEQRAQAYVDYFKQFKAGPDPLEYDALIAAADSSESNRPRLTLEPLSKALNLPLDTRFKAKDAQGLADDLRSRHPHVHAAIICWHHGEIPELLRALGADDRHVLPNGAWPEKVYDWVVVLHFDHEGRLDSAKCQEEGLKVGG